MDTYIKELTEQNQGGSIESLCMREQDTRPQRVREAFQKAAQRSDYEWLEAYALLALGERVEEANSRLYEMLTAQEEKRRRKLSLHDPWSLVVNPLLIRLYYNFGSKGRNLLTPEVEKAVLDLLWERMLYKNDITLARESVWHMTGSENHDLNFKICALLSSQIFKDLEEYRNRVYPDSGHGGGTGYWFHNMYAFMGGDVSDTGPEGGAARGDGKPHCAQEHYEAWTEFFQTYFCQRAKKGFFLEASATGYMKWTLSFISLLMEFCEDTALRKTAHDFFDLIWCEWAQEQIGGRRGGAKTRFVFEDAQTENDSMYYMARFLLGGEGIAGHSYYFQLLSDYALPEIVWDMVINRQEMGSYEYYSRRPGEEEAVFPRPAGEERTLMCDTDSRMLHYSYITPEYILGTQMDHPYMVHSHLSCASRWNGLLLGAMPDAYIFPSGFEEKETSSGRRLRPTGAMYRSVQYKDTLICAQHRGYFRADPQWYPQNNMPPCRYGIYMGKQFDELVQKQDWFFVREGDSFAAFRPAFGKCSMTEKYVLFDDCFAPAVIIAGGKTVYGSFEKFQENVLARQLRIGNTVVPGYYTVHFHTGEAELYFNAANSEAPKINDTYIDYSYPWAFDSPYIRGKYGDGLITIQKGERSLQLDFREEGKVC